MQQSVLIGLFAVLASSVQAHTLITSVNGQTQCLRGTKAQPNYPSYDPSSKEMECNVDGANPAASTCPFKAGEKITLQWNHNGDTPGDEIIAETHKGPCAVYISKVGSGKWSKIHEYGFQDRQWCTDKLRADKGKMSFTLPKELADGQWILRGEVIALHEGNKLYGADSDMAAQYYMRCMDIEISGGQGQIPSPAIAIPGPDYFTAADSGVHYDVYKGSNHSDYKVPGPPICTFGGADSSYPGEQKPTSTPSNNYIPPVQTTKADEYAPPAQSTKADEYAPPAQSTKADEYAPSVQTTQADEYAPPAQSTKADEYAPVEPTMPNEYALPVEPTSTSQQASPVHTEGVPHRRCHPRKNQY